MSLIYRKVKYGEIIVEDFEEAYLVIGILSALSGFIMGDNTSIWVIGILSGVVCIGNEIVYSKRRRKRGETKKMQKAEIQRRYQDWDAMLDCLSEAYEYICTEEGIAKFFRMYASCYEVCGQDEIAICLYSLSLVYEKSTIAADAVFALQDLTGYTMENFSMSDRMRLLRNYDLPLSVSRDNLNILGRLMRDDKIHQKYPEEMKKIVQRFTVLSSAYDMGY
jgi:hypothetical protein